MTRKQLLDREISSISKKIVSGYQPDKVIVFGSYASGKIKETSDLDIAIVKNTSERFLDRTKRIAFMISPKVAVDILVYTPKELLYMKRQGNYFATEIEKGKVIYEK